jgi:hypothetical protein
MKQLSLLKGMEACPQVQKDKEIFKQIKAISPEDIMLISQYKPRLKYTTNSEWDGRWFRTSWWVSWSPFLSVYHPKSGVRIMFNADDEDLPEVADKISEILS